MQRARPTTMTPVRYSGLVGEEHPGQREHQQRADHPGEEERDPEEAAVARNLPMSS